MRSVHSILSVGLLCGGLCGAAFALDPKFDALLGETRDNDGAGKATSADLSAYLTSATAASTYAPAASVTALQARATVTEQNIALATWDLWAHLGLPGQDMVQAWVDPFQTNSGMAASTNATFTTGKWSTMSPGVTNIISGSGATVTAQSSYELASNGIDGDDHTRWTSNNAKAWYQVDFGAGVTKVVTGYAITCKSAQFPSSDWTLETSNNGTDWTVVDTRAGQTWGAIEKKTFSLTTATTASRYFRVNISAPDSYTGFQELAFYSAAKADITLRSVASTAAASPTHGSLFLCAVEQDAITLGTDVVAKISKESAFASPVTLTLTKLLTIGAYVYYWGEADYTAGSGTTMVAEIVTANAKGLDLYRISHSWR